MITLPPSEHDLHAYIDHRLPEEDRLRLETWLASHPDTAARVKAWQLDTQHLRSALAAGLQQRQNPALDPFAVRRTLRRRQYRRLASAAVLLLAVGVGGLSGWQARDLSLAAHTALPMTDALQAYRLFAVQDMLPADLVAQRSEDLQRWLDRRFNRAERLPDLAAAGFSPVSGRLMSTDQGAAAMVLYQAADGRRLSFYIRPPGPNHSLLPRGNRRDGELQADYWSGPGYNYALVSSADEPAAPQLKQAIGI